MNNDELKQIFSNISDVDANRYIASYRYLYQGTLDSLLKSIELNEEILQIKHAISYQNEILPILRHNQRLAKQEKKKLYDMVTRSWKKFDERIQKEINVQYQLEHLKKKHQDLTHTKIKQERYQTLGFKLHDTNNNITRLKSGRCIVI